MTTIPKITKLLKYRRPAWSTTEADFIHQYIDTIPGVYSDKYGNRLLVSEGSRTIISTHTDTVHWAPGLQQVQVNGDIVSLHPSETEKPKENKTAAKPRQPLANLLPYNHRKPKRQLLTDIRPTTARPYGSNCLGADDTAGIYAAMRMIEAGVKATFIFHRAEEIGGCGSQWLADKYSKWIGSFDRCVALDRRGTADVITSQWGGRCCSDEFGLALAQQLGMGHKLAAGVFTDSANYTHLIPECSNISIGYQHEHSSLETLDLNYLEHVITRLIKVDWEALPVERDWNAEYEEQREEQRELEELERLWQLEKRGTLAGLRDDIREIKDIQFDSELDLDSGFWDDKG